MLVSYGGADDSVVIQVGRRDTLRGRDHLSVAKAESQLAHRVAAEGDHFA